MRVNLIVWTITSVLVYLLLCIIYTITGFISYGWYISDETEQKYLRNIHSYYPLYADQIVSDQGGDTLSYMSITSFSEVHPFYKWKIMEVGLIKPYSKLHEALDSIAATYVEPENKYR
jgi:hypothetical protein